MRFDIVTIFPEFFSGTLDYGIVRRAREADIIDVRIHDLRQFTHDRHKTVDDRPFGGGEGMVLKPEPLFDAVESLMCPPAPDSSSGSDADSSSDQKLLPGAVVLLSAAGKLFRQPIAHELSRHGSVVMLCGRYEGVDERVAEHLATHELSIGDFVLSGGELAAALVIDAVTRLLPGALGNEASSVNESFSDATAGEDESLSDRLLRRSRKIADEGNEEEGAVLPGYPGPVLLDWPHYTRPAEFRGWNVPEVLLSGNHEEIRRWRRSKAIEKTRRNRPDLLR